MAPPEALGASAVEEQVRSVLRQVANRAGAIVVSPPGAKPRISVKFAMVKKPNKGFATWRGCVAPNAGSKSIIRQKREGDAIES